MIQSKGIFLVFVTIAFTACTSKQNVFISGKMASIHSKPNEKSKLIHKIVGNTEATIIDEVTSESTDFRHWFKVRLQNQLEGYVYSDYIDIKPHKSSKVSFTYPKLKIAIKDGKLQILEKNNSKILDTIKVGNQIQNVIKTEQIRQFLFIVMGNVDESEEEYEGVVYDLNERKIIIRNLSQQTLMHICYFESVSPDDQFLVFDSGTSSIRDKFVYDLSTSKFHVFKDMSKALLWIAPKTFLYFDTLKENKTNLPIRKGDSVLEEKRIWRNGTIYRTNITRYSSRD